MEPLFAGVDVGTSGIRVLFADAAGQVHARASTALSADISDGHHEQSCEEWWQKASEAIRAALRQLGSVESLRAIAVDGTSGTLVCADRLGNPVGKAIMYNDARAQSEARELRARSGLARLSYSWALPKALWIKNHEPKRFTQIHRLLHQADWIVGKLCGSFGITDYSNGLKMGLDLDSDSWPSWIDSSILSLLPSVVAPGTQIGTVTRVASTKTGLPHGLPVVTAATDGVAACLASGLHRLGDYSTSLGSTLTFKGLAAAPVTHPMIYAHKLPGELWLPGAASNVGCNWIRAWFSGQDVQTLDREAASLLPNVPVIYPLIGQGERFPFADERFTARVADHLRGAELFAAGLLGTACVERLCYEVLDACADTTGGEVYTTGGGSRSEVWMQLRADVCQRVYHRPAYPEAAMGAAILAATGTHFDSVKEASEQITNVSGSFHPRQNLDDVYERFLRDLRIARG